MTSRKHHFGIRAAVWKHLWRDFCTRSLHRTHQLPFILPIEVAILQSFNLTATLLREEFSSSEWFVHPHVFEHWAEWRRFPCAWIDHVCLKALSWYGDFDCLRPTFLNSQCLWNHLLWWTKLLVRRFLLQFFRNLLHDWPSHPSFRLSTWPDRPTKYHALLRIYFLATS